MDYLKMFILGNTETATSTEGIIALIISTLLAGLAGFQKMKKKATDSDLKEAIKEELKKEVDPKIDKLVESVVRFNEKITGIEKEYAILNDRVKGIYRALDNIPTEILSNLEKMESNLKDELKDQKDDFKEQFKEVRDSVRSLEQNKLDKSK